MATPDDRRYTDQHEWALVQGTDGTSTVVRVGITDHAQDALGDIVFVQLPEVGDEVAPGTPIGEVESTKSVSDVYAPVAGDRGRRERPRWPTRRRPSTPIPTARAGWSTSRSPARAATPSVPCSTPTRTRPSSTPRDRGAPRPDQGGHHYDRAVTHRNPVNPGATVPHPARPVDPWVDLLVPYPRSAAPRGGRPSTGRPVRRPPAARGPFRGPRRAPRTGGDATCTALDVATRTPRAVASARSAARHCPRSGSVSRPA